MLNVGEPSCILWCLSKSLECGRIGTLEDDYVIKIASRQSENISPELFCKHIFLTKTPVCSMLYIFTKHLKQAIKIKVWLHSEQESQSQLQWRLVSPFV